MYDVQQLLKRFGTIIYTGNPMADLELIQDEVKELFNQNLIDRDDYKTALLIIRAAQNRLQ
jgi:uncharacterized protein YqgQ